MGKRWKKPCCLSHAEECHKCSESQQGLVHRGAGLRRPGWAPFPAPAHAVPWDLMPTVPCLCSAGLASLALHFLQVQPYSLLAYHIAVQLFLLCSATEVSFWLWGLWSQRSQACPKKWMLKLSPCCWPVQLSSGAFCSMWLMPVFVSLCFHALLSRVDSFSPLLSPLLLRLTSLSLPLSNLWRLSLFLTI